MSKRLSTIILVMVSFGWPFANLSFAQEGGSGIAPEFGYAVFSPSFGITYTDIQMEGSQGSTIETKPQVGFSLGLSVYIPSRSPYVDYQSGLYYSQSKTNIIVNQVETQGGDTIYNHSDYDLSFQRLSLPVIMRVYPFQKSTGIYFSLGAVANYLMSAEREGIRRTQRVSNSQTTWTSAVINSDVTELYNTLVVDGLAGIGFGLPIGGGFGIAAELTYRYGLTQLAKDSASRADTFYVSFGIGF